VEDERRRIFKLIETADNFIKYAPPSRRPRAAERARKRYEKAGKLAERAGAGDLVEQVSLRLGDIERRLETIGEDLEAWNDDGADGGSILTSELPDHARERVPPGQRVTRGWPVLHEGGVPRFDRASWHFDISGHVDRPLRLSYDELMTLDHIEMRSDFHCVTGWSKLDNVWAGVKAAYVLGLASPKSGAGHVLVHGEHGYTANVPLSAMLQGDALLAWRHNGKDLEPKHGWPLRLVVPSLYAWKSVKWVRAFEVLESDRRGYWEVRGYHNQADPWREERYSFQE
jgi:DMSO/TMAO reductase YedYZ molybdopterin-dependent catalytic subunit